MDAHTATTTLEGVLFTASDASTPVIAIVNGAGAQVHSPLWKGVQGWWTWEESMIDISGLTTKQDLTAFIVAVDEQQPLPIMCNIDAVAGGPISNTIYEYLYVTDRRITVGEWHTSIGPTAAGNSSGVSFTKGGVDQGSLIFGRTSAYQSATTATGGFPGQNMDLVKVWQQDYGLATATAADRLYCYRGAWMYFSGYAVNVLLPDVRFVVNYMTDQEPDLVYIERLRRSYEVGARDEPEAT